ncbi:MAG TPA: hypothetical protein VK188_05855 [Holophaga sp.]|nr:hypothetical protein [Holophaga sp.]
MPRILVRNLSEKAHKALSHRAALHRVSLEAEITAILEPASSAEEGFVLPIMLTPRQKGGERLSEIVSEGRRRSTWTPAPS